MDNYHYYDEELYFESYEGSESEDELPEDYVDSQPQVISFEESKPMDISIRNNIVCESRIEAHTSSVREVVFFPELKRFASCAHDKHVYIHSTETGRCVKGLLFEDWMNTIIIYKENETFLCAGDSGEVMEYDVKRMRPKKQVYYSSVYEITRLLKLNEDMILVAEERRNHLFIVNYRTGDIIKKVNNEGELDSGRITIQMVTRLKLSKQYDNSFYVSREHIERMNYSGDDEDLEIDKCYESTTFQLRCRGYDIFTNSENEEMIITAGNYKTIYIFKASSTTEDLNSFEKVRRIDLKETEKLCTVIHFSYRGHHYCFSGDYDVGLLSLIDLDPNIPDDKNIVLFEKEVFEDGILDMKLMNPVITNNQISLLGCSYDCTVRMISINGYLDENMNNNLIKLDLNERVMFIKEKLWDDNDDNNEIFNNQSLFCLLFGISKHFFFRWMMML